MSDRQAPWITGMFSVLAAIITAVAGFAGAIWTAQNGKLPEGLIPKETVTVTATQTVTVQAPDPSASPSSATVFLQDLKPVEGQLEAKSVTWRGETFPRSLVNSLSGCSEEGPVDWVIPAGSKVFKSEVGVDTASVEPESKVTFIVYLDGEPQPSKTIAVGKHETVEFSLGDHSRIRLESVIDQNRRNNCNTEAFAVWGDARLDAS